MGEIRTDIPPAPVTRVCDLTPGDRVTLHHIVLTFVAAVDHPLWRDRVAGGIALVVWHSDDRGWHHDAIAWRQVLDPYLGTVDHSHGEDDRKARLEQVFGGGR